MSNELSNELEKWKDKYLTSIDQMEQREQDWQEKHDVMCETLAKVSVAAKGIDYRLDEKLDDLQESVRTELEASLLLQQANQLAELIKSLDDEKSKRKSQLIYCFEKLITPLTQYNLPDQHKVIVKRIHEMIHASDAVDHFEEIIEGYTNVLSALPEMILADDFYRVIEISPLQKFIDKVMMRLGKEPFFANQNEKENSKKSSIELIQLLDLLSRNDAFKDETNILRERLIDGLKIDELPEILHSITTMLLNIFNSEYERIELFFEKFTKRFAAVENLIINILEVDSLSNTQSNYLNQEVCDSVAEVKGELEKAESLERLEKSLTSRLDRIIDCMGEYKKIGEERLQNAKRQLDELHTRLKESESDIKSLQDELQQEHHVAMHDPLTQLPNRLAYDQAALGYIKRYNIENKSLYLVVIDIDYFKKINDSYGHLAGDKVLKKISEILMESTDKAAIIARYGGEEFVMLFYDLALNELKHLVEKIRHDVEYSGFHFQNEPVRITASFGVASYKENDSTELLFQRADGALYQAKKKGRNTASFAIS